MQPHKIRETITEEAQGLGFDLCRFTAAALPDEIAENLKTAIAEGHLAGMDWMADTIQRRSDPRAMWAEAKTAIVLALNYGPRSDPLVSLAMPERATISVYARNRDYHDIIKGRLKQMAGKIAAITGSDVKVFVDTAPLMEKPLAAQAGIGWQGKHTNLVSREFGSWLFLGVILTEAEFAVDESEIDHCGSCRACLDICPTDAFPAPYRLDAGRCISYLTIEHKEPIPFELREKMGNRIYGCDDCLAVCPWNKFAAQAREAKLMARQELDAPQLAMLAQLDDAKFRSFFSGSPIKRIGRDRFLRNVLIAMGNSDDRGLLPEIRPHLEDDNPLVRGAAIWALARLMNEGEFCSQREKRVPYESDANVREEWNYGMLMNSEAA